ncbi:Hsp33 family molecular chaperone HslO [Lysobacter sp. K5869]|uniref:Hsp33 family molecular chaperone HslO n=1 Tax=Lysobacter sp. K5869 TaxID=2820808 RepID=UPI001C05F5EA|nr:Hsp33 family molecular chaperone HslO [Lysobacter sp. K5869]QWP76588.1 Hsp33 family molecular chaperone HslO [Lysobacter sp. K5869]
MTSAAPAQPASADGRDRLARFLIEAAGVRGVHVHLDETWRQIRERAEYPAAAAELLGEAAAAAALFTGHAKVEGRLSVQLRGEGALRALFAECTAAGTLRGIVQLAEDAGEISRDLRELGEQAVLAITIENPSAGGRDPIRYQGLVALESDSLAGAFEGYFRQSEQLPTRLLLAADGDRAAGLMLQKLPGDGGDEDGWTRVGALFDTLSDAELLELPADDLLHRLFHEDGVQLLGGKPLAFACSCSRERVEAMLVSLGREEAEAAVEAADGVAQVRCEFCGQTYRFDGDQVAGLFAAAAAEMEAPQRVQ